MTVPKVGDAFVKRATGETWVVTQVDLPTVEPESLKSPLYRGGECTGRVILRNTNG